MKATANGTATGGERQTSGSGSGRYFAVAALLVALLGLLYGGAWWLTRAAPARQSATVTTAPPTTLPTVAAAVPTAVPPTPARVRPTSWTVTEMTDPQTGRTDYMAPPEVVAMVLEDYQEVDRYFSEHTFDLTETDYSRFFVDPELSILVKTFRSARLRGEANGRTPLLEPRLRVLDFAADGLSVRVAEDFDGEAFPVYDLVTHELVRLEKAPEGTGISTLVYDSVSGKWKGSESNFGEFQRNGESR